MSGEVSETKIGAGDHNEAKNDCSCLPDLAAVGPLNALQLGPRGAKKVEEAAKDRLPALRLIGAGRRERCRCLTSFDVNFERLFSFADRFLVAAFNLGFDVVDPVLKLCELRGAEALGVDNATGAWVDLWVGRGAVSSGNKLGIELIDVGRSVVERGRDVLAGDPFAST